jgi:hypothetical protein
MLSGLHCHLLLLFPFTSVVLVCSVHTTPMLIAGLAATAATAAWMACPFMTYPLSVRIRFKPPGKKSLASGALRSYFSPNRFLYSLASPHEDLIPQTAWVQCRERTDWRLFDIVKARHLSRYSVS